MNNEQTTSKYKGTNPSEQMKLKDAFSCVPNEMKWSKLKVYRRGLGIKGFR